MAATPAHNLFLLSEKDKQSINEAIEVLKKIVSAVS